MKIRRSLRALSRAGSARSPDPDKGHRTDSLKNSSRKSTSQFCKVGEFPRQGDVLHPLWRSSWRTRSTSDKARYVSKRALTLWLPRRDIEVPSYSWSLGARAAWVYGVGQTDHARVNAPDRAGRGAYARIGEMLRLCPPLGRFRLGGRVGLHEVTKVACRCLSQVAAARWAEITSQVCVLRPLLPGTVVRVCTQTTQAHSAWATVTGVSRANPNKMQARVRVVRFGCILSFPSIYARLTTATLDSTARKVFASHRVV